ncbi:lysylphosphatidylglycerol synthase transmembrane domain-containing protein [Massilia litorea]|uniref:Flippase-like domain-containing protein n=1 Tax=Massilia litorea TaxID=2769491 RepID=A0A7L9U4Q3_9BURK|nr:lysylphosphatidylglycerol synthase transmembrane domain-containing protein [Massilia litorea]QOL49016.1 flippase-like domain-containing protein [Massilia litorea]
MSKQPGKKWKAVLQVLVSACLIVFVFRNLDMGQVRTLAFHPQRAPILAAAFIAFNLSKIVAALRLNVYQRHAAVQLSEAENLRLYYAGMFLNLFLPGGIGGDGYKVLVLHRRHAVALRTLVTITLVDRVGGMLALLVILCTLLPPLSFPWHAPGAVVFALASVAAIVAVFVLAHRWLIKLDAAGLARVFALGIGVQLLQLTCMGMLLVYLGTPAAYYLAFLAMFLVSSIAAVLPLSVGGLGVREATFLFGVNLFHLDPTYGVIASSWFFLITVLSSMIGALFLGRFSLRAAATG